MNKINVVVLSFFGFSCLSYADSLGTKIDRLIDQQLPHATVGVLIKDINTGKILYSRNLNKLLSPASSMKLFTAAAALYQLKPDYHFTTSLAQKNKDYYLTFSGSPALTSQNLTDLLAQLKKNKINTIQGNLVLDVSKFKSPYYASGTSFDDLGWYYSAPDNAAIINENAADYDFTTAKKLGDLVQIKAKSPTQVLTIINEVKTTSRKEEKDHCNLNIEIKPNNTLRLFGCLAQEEHPRTMKLAVPDPLLMVKQLVQRELKKQDILLKGQIITGKTPADATILISHNSDNLDKLINHMLKESDNLYANSLTKELGYSVTGEGTYKQGAYAIKQILAKNTHLDSKQMEVTDGMGTRYNLVTAEQMVVLLSDLYQNENLKPIILEALPQAGVSGTLIGRMKKTALDKLVFAKTGTMHDVSSLSGYIIKPGEHPLVFSIIINGINKPISTAKSLEEKILLALDEEELKTPTANY